MSGGSIAHIRMGWAECIHALRPPPLRVSSVKTLALVDKAKLTAVAKKLQCAMTAVFTLCIFCICDLSVASGGEERLVLGTSN